ncbi:MAG: Rha family transcriptional regulator [Aeromonas veronii]
MNELVTVVDGKPVVTSKQVADHFGVKGGHRYILSVIRGLIEKSGDFGEQKYLLSSYTSSQNKVLPCYYMDRDGFTLVAMRLTTDGALEWQIKYIEAFNAMERELMSGNAKFGSVMDALNDACRLMESDKQKASVFGKGLHEWRKLRKDHMERVEKLHTDVQLLLNFK